MNDLTKDSNVKALAAELAKNIKTASDLGVLSRALLKLIIESALGKELEEHLGYEKTFTL